MNMSTEELELACNDVFTNLKVTKDEADYLEKSTRLQSQSTLWYEHRVGRITASIFRKVKCASPGQPPSSLVKTIIKQTTLDSPRIPSLKWEIDSEDVARKAHLESADSQHTNLQYFASGLHVNMSFPHLQGATPDGIIQCDCCGKGLFEVKCSFKHRDEHPHDVDDHSLYLKKNHAGEFHLSKDHDYFIRCIDISAYLLAAASDKPMRLLTL